MDDAVWNINPPNTGHGRPQPTSPDFTRIWEALRLKLLRICLGELLLERGNSVRQWLLADLGALDGKQVPGPEWGLPQPTIAEDVLTKYIDERMFPLPCSLCGCQELQGYPERLGGK